MCNLLLSAVLSGKARLQHLEITFSSEITGWVITLYFQNYLDILFVCSWNILLPQAQTLMLHEKEPQFKRKGTHYQVEWITSKIFIWITNNLLIVCKSDFPDTTVNIYRWIWLLTETVILQQSLNSRITIAQVAVLDQEDYTCWTAICSVLYKLVRVLVKAKVFWNLSTILLFDRQRKPLPQDPCKPYVMVCSPPPPPPTWPVFPIALLKW